MLIKVYLIQLLVCAKILVEPIYNSKKVKIRKKVKVNNR
jgi:hypothetical protein